MNLNEWRHIAASLFPGALPFLDAKIAEQGGGELVLAADNQMYYLLDELHRKRTPEAEEMRKVDPAKLLMQVLREIERSETFAEAVTDLRLIAGEAADEIERLHARCAKAEAEVERLNADRVLIVAAKEAIRGEKNELAAKMSHVLAENEHLASVATGLRAELAKARAVCLCGCPDDEHESYEDDGEACGKENHLCMRVSHGIAADFARLRAVILACAR